MSSMSKKDSLGDRMKRYEAVSENYFTCRTPVIVRIDGRAFHTWTKGLSSAFHVGLHDLMMYTTQYLCENMQNAVLGYTQSDEITIVMKDWGTLSTQAWFDNRQNKIESVSASMATAAFNSKIAELVPEKIGRLATFDSRAYSVPRDDVVNALVWRQNDASRNSVQMLGRMYCSQKEMQGKNNSQVQDMLMLKHGINWNDIDTWKKRGAAWVKRPSVDADGIPTKVWIRDENIPIFTQDRDYIESLLQYEDRVKDSDVTV
jgi:tRNA(His) guanylyltransferase